MLSLIFPFAVFVAVGTGLAGLTIWSRRMLLPKIGAIVLAVSLFGSGYVTTVELLGRPKPIDTEWFGAHLAEARVVAADMHEDVAIYLWLAVEGEESPRSYALPWSDQSAQQLNDAMQEAEEEGTDVQMRDPFDGAPDDEEPMFYAAPEVPLPPKA
jgi:hypothetical protein